MTDGAGPSEDFPPSEEAGRGALLSPETLVSEEAGEKFKEPETSGKALPDEGFEELFPLPEDTGDETEDCSLLTAAEAGEDACPALETLFFASEVPFPLVARVSAAEAAA